MTNKEYYKDAPLDRVLGAFGNQSAEKDFVNWLGMEVPCYRAYWGMGLLDSFNQYKRFHDLGEAVSFLMRRIVDSCLAADDHNVWRVATRIANDLADGVTMTFGEERFYIVRCDPEDFNKEEQA